MEKLRVRVADLDALRRIAEDNGLRVLVVSEADGFAEVELERPDYSAWKTARA